MPDCYSLPTHIARVVSRLNVTGPDASADTFLVTSYVMEAVLKTAAIGLCSGIRQSSEDVAYRLEYDLLRADGLGGWESALSTAVGHSYVGYIDQDLQGLVAWVTKKRTKADDEWARQAARECAAILNLLEVPDSELPRAFSVRHLLGHLVRIRNKTKAHGAVGEDFFAAANSPYLRAAELLLRNCPAMKWDWFHLSLHAKKDTVRAIRLCGTEPKHALAKEAEMLRVPHHGVYFRTHERGRLFSCGNLLRANRECSVFLMPNGSYTDTGSAEYIDYANGHVEQCDASAYLAPPAPLPPSATEGLPTLAHIIHEG